MTRLVIILTSTGKCFELCRAEVNSSHNSDAQVCFQLVYDGRIHSWLVPEIREAEDLGIERHDIQNGLLLSPSANRSSFTDILRKAAAAEPFREVGISSVRA